MSEQIVRVLVLAGIIALVAAVAWVGSRRRTARPQKLARPDLAQGVYLFSSSTCAACSPAKATVTKVVGGEFSEVRFEDDPQGFGRWRIAKVPSVIVVGEAGDAVMFEGVPRKRDLLRVVSGKW